MKKVVSFIFRIYRAAVSPFLGNRCRFYPSCSHYAEEAVMRKGMLRGIALTAVRLLKCNPFYPGGFDPVE